VTGRQPGDQSHLFYLFIEGHISGPVESGCVPQRAESKARIKPSFLPSSGFIATAIHLAMVPSVNSLLALCPSTVFAQNAALLSRT
jgi:hypothetical protein